MRNTWITIFLFAISIQLAAAQWVLEPHVTTANLWKVKFVDRDNGWIIGQYFNRSGIIRSYAYRSSILKTTNAGASWSEQVLDDCILSDIEFVNPMIGWAAGVTRGRSGLLYKTGDGGMKWDVADSNAAGFRYVSIHFLDDLQGWVGGWNDTASIVLRTSDGGTTWQRSIHQGIDINDLFFLDPLTGWIVGQDGSVRKSTDGGMTWQTVLRVPDPINPGGFSPLRRIQFVDPMHGYAVGGISGGETKLWSSNGGTTWNVVSKAPGSSLHGVWFIDANNGWTVGGANAGLTIQRTIDGGQTWAKQNYPVLGRGVGYFEDITFVSPSEGWIVGDSGTVLKTTSGGGAITGIGDTPEAGAPTEFQLGQNYPNPFNPTTTISFSLPSVSFVSLRVFNALGKEVSTLLLEELPAGIHFRQWDAEGLPSGVYFYRLHAGSFLETRKLILLR